MVFNILVFKPLPQPLSTGEGSGALRSRIAYSRDATYHVSTYMKGILRKGSLSCGEGGGRGFDRIIFFNYLYYLSKITP